MILSTGVLNQFVGILNHANVDFRLGPLNRIFNMSELHRWHHARSLADANANYSGGALIFWDLVFGTRRQPNRRLSAGDVGLAGNPAFPYHALYRQWCYPVCDFRQPEHSTASHGALQSRPHDVYHEKNL